MSKTAFLPGLDPGLAVRTTEKLVALRFCGHDLSHSREANLSAIDKLLEGNAFYTLGIESVANAVKEGKLTREGVLRSVTALTGESPDPAIVTGPNSIAPNACMQGLWEAAKLMRAVRDRRGTVIFGAGHSGSMVSYYNRMAAYMRSYGCQTPIAGGGTEVQKDWYLDFVDCCAVVSDTCGLHHTHMTTAMEAFLDALPALPDLAICDHGFGGAAINRGVPCIAVMDTNDPGFAIAKELGEDFVLVPFNDNRPNFVTVQLAEIMIELIEAA